MFHTGNPDSALWEFKHGNGNFKRGDLVGLREIKRRASRHALVHREYSNQKPTPSQPGTPAEPMPPIHDTADPRVVPAEHVYDLNARLLRSEENAHYMHIKQQAMVETINRLLQFNQEISRALLNLVPHDSPVHRDGKLSPCWLSLVPPAQMLILCHQSPLCKARFTVIQSSSARSTSRMSLHSARAVNTLPVSKMRPSRHVKWPRTISVGWHPAPLKLEATFIVLQSLRICLLELADLLALSAGRAGQAPLVLLPRHLLCDPRHNHQRPALIHWPTSNSHQVLWRDGIRRLTYVPTGGSHSHPIISDQGRRLARPRRNGHLLQIELLPRSSASESLYLNTHSPGPHSHISSRDRGQQPLRPLLFRTGSMVLIASTTGRGAVRAARTKISPSRIALDRPLVGAAWHIS